MMRLFKKQALPDTFKLGDRVMKTSGYLFPGTIVSVFYTLSHQTRYVVESYDSPGLLHIFNGSQLAIDYNRP